MTNEEYLAVFRSVNLENGEKFISLTDELFIDVWMKGQKLELERLKKEVEQGFWEPEIGKYYKFFDDDEYSEVKKLSELNSLSPPEVYKCIDSDGIGWRYMEPVNGEFGK